MKTVNFTKMVGAGNDFVVVDSRYSILDTRYSLSKLARLLCKRRTAIGGDGLLLLEGSKKADLKMRIFNPDGSEAETCGNGLRCAALYSGGGGNIKIETEAGIYEARVTRKDRVKVKIGEPKDLKAPFPIVVNGRKIRVNYIDTGVPHTVIFVQGLGEIDVASIGRSIRNHTRFRPRGTNVNFVEIIDDKNMKMRTYERGVEGETLACGTGAVASAIVSFRRQGTKREVNVYVKGGLLKVYFKNANGKIKDVYLEGEAKKVYNGEVDYV